MLGADDCGCTVARMRYHYVLIPIIRAGGEMLADVTISTEERLAVGDVVPASPGTWIVERVGTAGTTQWASEAIQRDDPRTITAPVPLHCRVEP